MKNSGITMLSEQRRMAGERIQQKEDGCNLQGSILAEQQKQEYSKNVNIYAPIQNTNLPGRNIDNFNLIKIIWQLKLRTTLLHNVIHQILHKWPEDSASVLEMVERNKAKYENSTPSELMKLVDVSASEGISYDKVIQAPIFNLPDKPFPSRIQSSRIGRP